jgi:hypothetical protein
MTSRAAKRKRAAAAPFRGAPGSTFEGATNDEALAAIVQAIGGPLVAGSLYRLRYGQGLAGTPAQSIGEYLGSTREVLELNGYAEPVLLFALRNPVPPTVSGTREQPLRLWPLDVHYIAPAEPGDLDVPMHYRGEGAPTMLSAPGRPPVQ